MKKENHHIVTCQVHVQAKNPREAARKALSTMRQNGFVNTKTRNKKGYYIVRWSIDMFHFDSMNEAKKEALVWIKKQRGVSLCHVFTIQDKSSKKCFSVDLDDEYANQLLPLSEKEFEKS